ncbi:DNA-binding transcriptional LysR family regulator [Rhizomicrobium palustre]|uniref:DNA-binding transcriptional LysR family regulator n=1 Tax=Rhizomicrobium palustre TaxID=189966 RepID=A0A846MUV4_9PROT|nr:LysR family transcriptional regulator [Rhizomicrobium palustre]NIK87009.1 DNA-binding transcriptional LysR family regulator [Rhizomicrobium palustre]
MDSSRLDLNLLVTLEALLAERNVTRAAARLKLSQPAVSAQLKRLRDLFGDPLLIPAHRGMTPTAKALELLEELRPALDQVRGTLAQQNFDPAKARATFSLACSDYTQSVVGVPLVLRLRKIAPHLRLSLRALDPARIEEHLARGEADLALMTPELAPQGLRYRTLFEERYVLILRKAHPKAKLSLKDYLALEHVMVSPSGGQFATAVDQSLAAQGLKRSVVLSVASFLILFDIVARTDFAALVPERLVKGRASEFRVLEPPLPVAGFSVGMVWHERGHSHPAQRWLRETIIALAKTAP